MELKIILIIVIGVLIGWVTNYVAIKMLFRPYKEINLLFFKIQGVIPKKKHEIGIRIAEAIKSDVISMNDITTSLDKEKIGDHLEKIVDTLLKGKVKEEIVKVFPMAAMFMSSSVEAKITESIKSIVLGNKEMIIEQFLGVLEDEVDFEAIIVRNVDSFSLEKLEEITFSLAKTEFKHIEIIGAVLGGIIGAIQAAVSFFI
ncbi:MAG: DUF445 family protein [Fusobacteriaceae bacterium]|nr:DUF445 family protein [Fusobacteriaceae bacterium]